MKETYIQNAPLFSSLSFDEQSIIAQAMKEMAFTKGEMLLAQGQPAERMYLIRSGWVKQVTVLDGGRTLVNNLGAGSLVGDMDVLLDQPAASTAQTNSDVSLWSLSQADLYQIFSENPRLGLKLSSVLGCRIKQVDRYLIDKRLRSMSLFADLEADQLSAIAEKLQSLEVRRGGLIFRAGAPGEAMFIIEEGEVMLTSAAEEAGEPYRLLGPGDVLGDMAVLAGKSYDSLARASSEAVLWVLRRDDFASIVARFPSVRVAVSSRLSQPLGSDDRALALKQLSRLPLFADLPLDTMNVIAGMMVLRHYPAGERVFTLNDAGDSLIIVDGGSIRLTDADGRAHVLKPGESFGHDSLLTGKSRNATAVTETDSNIWILYKSDFEALLARYPALGTSLGKAVTNYLQDSSRLFLYSHLRSIPLFAGLGDAELRDIAAVLRLTRTDRGDVIFGEGQRGDAMYFIETGEVQIATRIGDSYQLSFERLGAGGFFGEIALLSDGPRKSTARAVVGDTQLWGLYKTDFDRLVAKYPQVALTLGKAIGERLARIDARVSSPRPQLKPPSPGGGLPALGARPLTVKPSAVPVVKRPAQPGSKSANRMQATPLAVKPATTSPQTGTPQARPVSKRPPQPAVAPRPRVAGQPQNRAVAIRPTPRPPAPVSQADPLTLAVMGGVNWMMARSIGFKFRLAALTMLFVWLCGIAMPVTVISAMAVSAGASSAPLAVAGVAVNIGTEDATQSQIALAPTFTPTPLPTSTPTQAPTQKPVVVQSPPTAPPTRVPPTPRPTARPTSTPASVVPAVAEAPAPPTPSVDYKVEKIRRLTACENQGNHNLYIVVLDQQGNGVPNMDLQVVWDSGKAMVRTGNKVENISYLGVDAKTTKGYVDFAMYKGRYKVMITNAVSEESEWMSPDIPEPERCDRNDNPIANSLYHYSYLIVFRKVR